MGYSGKRRPTTRYNPPKYVIRIFMCEEFQQNVSVCVRQRRWRVDFVCCVFMCYECVCVCWNIALIILSHTPSVVGDVAMVALSMMMLVVTAAEAVAVVIIITVERSHKHCTHTHSQSLRTQHKYKRTHVLAFMRTHAHTRSQTEAHGSCRANTHNSFTYTLKHWLSLRLTLVHPY